MKPDQWREGRRALALLVEDRIVGVGRLGSNPVHPLRDLVEVEIDSEHRRQGHGTALLRELGRYTDAPLSSQARAGTDRHAFLRSLGATTYLDIPLQQISLGEERVMRWVRAVHDAVGSSASAVRWSRLPREEVVDALTSRYLWQHASWSPTVSREAIRPLIEEEFYESSILEGSWAVVRKGQITAVADLYDDPVGRHREGTMEAVDAATRTARGDAALCLAALLGDLHSQRVDSLLLDNHPTDPHAAPLLATVANRDAGSVELMEIPNGLTERLRTVR
jgi:hypothetical protein